MARRLGLAIVIVLLAFHTAGPARAAAVHDFHAAVAGAFGHYRLVMYSLRTGNQAIALFELDRMAANWKTIEQRFAASPPDIYANDPAWRDTLDAIGDAVEAGLAAAEAGDVKTAMRRLKPVRGEMSGLRRRNGVFLFPDCVENANLAFERLFAYRREPTDFVDAGAVNGLRRALAITVHWYETCRDTAPAAIRDDAQFRRIMDSAIDSLGLIWDAIDERNARRVINNLRGLRSSDGLLYLRFG
jgi:hypothetical protein